jgi:hypothetical protein
VEQFLVPTLLDDPAAVEHDQLVHARDRAQPMRDHERGPAFHESPQRLLDKDFALRVQCAGRLVEQQDRRITQDRPGQRDRCCCPPDSFTPRSPTIVSNPSGRAGGLRRDRFSGAGEGDMEQRG